MILSRLIASRLPSNLAALLILASWSGLAVAQSGDQWHAAGTTSSASSQSAAPTTTNSGWKLPNGQANTGDTQLVDEDSNPLRQAPNQKPAPKAPEPRSFQAPTNAAPMSAAKSTSAATYNSAQPAAQQRNRPAAVRPGTIIPQAYVAQQPQYNRAPANAPRQYVQPNYLQPNYQPNANNQNRSNSSNDTLWDTINVAFNGPPTQRQVQPQPQTQAPTSRVVKPQSTQTKRQSENLPMPGEGDYESNDPVMRYPGGPGEFADHLGGNCYHPYGEQGNCCEGCANPCCGDSCECGQPCGEAGCDCEPGCDCPPGPCKKDVFCIGPGDDESCHIVQIRWPKWQEVVVFGGVQGFKGPYDRGRDGGNFGFNEGFNIGAKVPYCAIGYQFGYRAAQSQLNGDTTGDNGGFNQSFVTAGLFHRQKEGLNFGVAWDALVDERGVTQNFHQIRTELSFVGCGCHECGFGATVGTNTHNAFDNISESELNYQASDQYVLFYRLHGCNGGEGKIYAGVNNDSDGILGADTLVPIGGCFSLQSGFSYLIPNQSNGNDGARNEAWNVAVGLVWHWDGQARKCYENCYRPLFNVADNGILIVDHQK